MTKTFSYGKNEKLKGRKLTEQLFRKGNTFFISPVKVFYMQPETLLDFPAKAGVGASGKNFKKAVERNRIKRILREAYRLEKPILLNYLEAKKKQVVFFILYTDKTLPHFQSIKTLMPLILQRLIKQLDERAFKNT
jgi:ribonuclease P protein component